MLLRIVAKRFGGKNNFDEIFETLQGLHRAEMLRNFGLGRKRVAKKNTT
jgi:hypothetical protein